MIIDFKEIPQANLGSGLQDSFELFSRDFLENLGYKVIEHPDRGADGKKDLIVSELRSGIGGETIIRWLVSCKHYAHSGKAVKDVDEPDILDRVAAHKCQGFLGVYSSLPASSLTNKLKGYSDRLEYQLFDRERIEKELLRDADSIKLARRFFPISINIVIIENPKPAKIFAEDSVLNCEFCNKDLLTTKNGIFAIVTDRIQERTNISGEMYYEEKHVYYSCKGNCDRLLEIKYRNLGFDNGGWNDIDDLLIPTLFIKNVMAYMNQIHTDSVSNEVHEKMKNLYLNCFPHVVRELTDKEKQRVMSLQEFGLV